jgi:hypothetical protein
MSRNKIRSRQRGLLSVKARMVIGASVFAFAALMLLIVFNVGDVKETRAFSSGDYRTVASGEWNQVDSWEVFDGENWSSAAMPPSASTNTIVIKSEHVVTLTDEIALNNLVIEKDGTLSIEANELRITKSNGKGGLQCFGKLAMGFGTITGDGDFVVGPDAILLIGAEDGIDKQGLKGNIQTTGKRIFHRDAEYRFSGNIKQSSGNGLPSTLKRITFDNPNGVVLDQNITVTGTASFERGVVSTGKYFLTIGSSSALPGEILRHSGTVSGTIRRWYCPQNINNIEFPMSDGLASDVFSYSCDIQSYQKGMIEMEFHNGDYDQSSRSPFDARQFVVGITESGYFTTALSHGAEEGWLKITSVITDTKETKTRWKITNRSSRGDEVQEGSRIEKISSVQNFFCGPNPFINHFFVMFYSDSNTSAVFQVMNSAGQQLHNETIQVKEGNNQLEYRPENELPEGVYIIRLSNSSEIHTLKIVKK